MIVASPPPRPLMIYDGHCNFCKFWIIRWQIATKGCVEYVASQDESIAREFPELPRERFDQAVQFIETDGHVYSGAEAVFRSLTYSRYMSWPLELYLNLPGVRPLTEQGYQFVAQRRQTFSFLTRLLWGREGVLPEYQRVRSVFFTVLGLIYLSAFWSLGTQITGLYGRNGILPVNQLMTAAQSQFEKQHIGVDRFYILPTLCWISASDAFLKGLCLAGAGLSMLLIVNLAPALCTFLLWLIYLSLVSVGRDFLSFQWDVLLLETGLLAIFFAPWQMLPWRGKRAPPSRAILWLLRWLLFRLMFESGLVKLISQDPNWRNFHALRFHYETQPLPTWIGWYVHQLPDGFQTVCVFLMFAIELGVPFFIFLPRRLRFIGASLLALLQLFILLTGNYCFFNWLTLALCLLLLDDAALAHWIPARWRKLKTSDPAPLTAAPTPPGEMALGEISVPDQPSAPAAHARTWPTWVIATVTPIILLVTGGQVAGMLTGSRSLTGIVEGLVSPLRSANTYGLFAVMTTNRREIVIEGSNDGKTWLPYEFKYKPGDLKRRPGFVAPHQPRLDWQMWFAALGNYQDNRWFVYCCARLLQGRPEVLALFEHNPFPNAPPHFIRAEVYDYHFSNGQQRRAEGVWWRREDAGEYMPPISLPEK